MGSFSEELLDEILENLQKVDDGLFFEIGYDAHAKLFELIITPEGKHKKIDLTREIIASAPPVKDWKFIAFKPALGFGFVTEYEDIYIDPKLIWFLPLNSKSHPLDIGIRIGIKNFNLAKEKQILSACYIVLDTCLGEESVMQDIAYVDVCDLPENPVEEGFIEFIEIKEYIEWIKRKTRKIH